MGLGRNLLTHLNLLKSRGTINGFSSVVEIGAQQLSNDFLRATALVSDCYRLFEKSKVDLGSTIDEGFSHGLEHLSERNPPSRDFWESIGFTYASLEFDGHRDSIPIDLNRDSLPTPLQGNFDLVINTGTTEHVANQDNAFRIIHDLGKCGSIMYHELPAGGMMMHGLFTYTPKFFWHLCRENQYEPISLQIVNCSANPVSRSIRDSNQQFAGNDPIPHDLVIPDLFVIAVLRKIFDRPFITPLDLPLELMPK